MRTTMRTTETEAIDLDDTACRSRWHEYFIQEGRVGCGGTIVNGPHATLDEAIRDAAEGLRLEIRALPPDCQATPRLVWNKGDLKAVVAPTPAGPAVVRLDAPEVRVEPDALAPALERLDALAAAWVEARADEVEAIRACQATDVHVAALHARHQDAIEAVHEAAGRAADQADVVRRLLRPDEPADDWEPIVIQTARHVVRLEPYCKGDVFDMGDWRCTIIALPG